MLKMVFDKHFFFFHILMLLVITISLAFAQQNQNSTSISTINTTATTPSSPSSFIDFSGHYRMTVGDRTNFRALLAKLGIGYFKRLAASAASYSYIISQNQTAGTYSLQTINSFTSPPGVTFRSGITFDDPALYDPTTRSTITVEGNKWTHVQVGRLTTLTTERTFHGGSTPKFIDVITKCDGVTVARKYVRV